MRQRLRDIGRCDACTIKEADHGTVCPTADHYCDNCGSLGHYRMTCNGLEHPGSWILAKAKANSTK